MFWNTKRALRKMMQLSWLDRAAIAMELTHDITFVNNGHLKVDGSCKQNIVVCNGAGTYYYTKPNSSIPGQVKVRIQAPSEHIEANHAGARHYPPLRQPISGVVSSASASTSAAPAPAFNNSKLAGPKGRLP